MPIRPPGLVNPRPDNTMATQLVAEDGTLSSIATDPTLEGTLPREIAAWDAGVLDVGFDGEQPVVEQNGSPNQTEVFSGSLLTENLLGSSGAELPPVEVPEGKAVVVRSDPDNSDRLEIMGDFPLMPGEAGPPLYVSNTDVIEVHGPDGNSVHWIVEAGQ